MLGLPFFDVIDQLLLFMDARLLVYLLDVGAGGVLRDVQIARDDG